MPAVTQAVWGWKNGNFRNFVKKELLHFFMNPQYLKISSSNSIACRNFLIVQFKHFFLIWRKRILAITKFEEVCVIKGRKLWQTKPNHMFLSIVFKRKANESHTGVGTFIFGEHCGNFTIFDHEKRQEKAYKFLLQQVNLVRKKGQRLANGN